MALRTVAFMFNVSFSALLTTDKSGDSSSMKETEISNCIHVRLLKKERLQIMQIEGFL